MGEGIFYPVVSGDDGWVSAKTEPPFNSTGNGLYFGSSVSYGPDRNVFIRFPDVTIPAGSTITEAFVRVTAYSSKSGICNGNCYFNAIDNAVAPTSITEYDNLAVTAAIAWDGIPDMSSGVQYDTPELKTILQIVIDRGGWNSGQAIQVLIKNNASADNIQRTFIAIDNSGSDLVELHITWTEPPPPVIVDIKTCIEAVRSKWWLKSDIQAGVLPISRTDLLSFIACKYPTRKKFLLLRYDHIPARNALNVQIGKAMKFRLYNPDPLFGIDLTTFKLRFDEGAWYRYGDSRLTFTEVSYREYKVYFNPPNFEYDSQVDVELYCEDNLNNPGIKLEIF